mgnify:CR=1 FL=1
MRDCSIRWIFFPLTITPSSITLCHTSYSFNLSLSQRWAHCLNLSTMQHINLLSLNTLFFTLDQSEGESLIPATEILTETLVLTVAVTRHREVRTSVRLVGGSREVRHRHNQSPHSNTQHRNTENTGLVRRQSVVANEGHLSVRTWNELHTPLPYHNTSHGSQAYENWFFN